MILVTGATGSVGSNVCRLAAGRGIAVRALVRPGSDVDPLVQCGAEPVLGDVTDRDSVAAATRGVDGVIHCAAQIGETWSTAGPRDYEAVNQWGTINVLDAAQAAGAARTVVLLSAVVGDRRVTTTEDSPLAPLAPGNSPYLRTKLAAYYEGMAPHGTRCRRQLRRAGWHLRPDTDGGTGARPDHLHGHVADGRQRRAPPLPADADPMGARRGCRRHRPPRARARANRSPLPGDGAARGHLLAPTILQRVSSPWPGSTATSRSSTRPDPERRATPSSDRWSACCSTPTPLPPTIRRGPRPSSVVRPTPLHDGLGATIDLAPRQPQALSPLHVRRSLLRFLQYTFLNQSDQCTVYALHRQSSTGVARVRPRSRRSSC